MVIVSGGLSACGGTEGPSKAEYIEKADRVCAAADPKLDAIWRSQGSKPTPKQTQTALRALVPEERKLLSELRALEAPDNDRDEIDRIYAARQRAVDELETAARTPASAFSYVEAAEDPPGFQETLRLASVYGMAACSLTQPGSVAA
jgi:hypothetical protein